MNLGHQPLTTTQFTIEFKANKKTKFDQKSVQMVQSCFTRDTKNQLHI